jgi:hypothetical protein
MKSRKLVVFYTVLVEDAKFIASFRGVKNKYFFLASPSPKKICKIDNFPTHHSCDLIFNLNSENTIPALVIPLIKRSSQHSTQQTLSTPRIILFDTMKLSSSSKTNNKNLVDGTTSRGGMTTGTGSKSVSRKVQSKGMKPSSSSNKTRRLGGTINTTTTTNGATARSTGGNTGDQLEKKLQATLHKATRDRDTEHRQWVVAAQRLGAARGEVKNLQRTVAEERRKHTTTTRELNRTKIELETMEVSVENLKRKVRCK